MFMDNLYQELRDSIQAEKKLSTMIPMNQLVMKKKFCLFWKLSTKKLSQLSPHMKN